MRADESAESSIEANRFRAETGSLEDGGVSDPSLES